MACALECAQVGSTNPEALREKVASSLRHSPALRSRLQSSLVDDGDGRVLSIETDRVNRVLIKLAQGHVAYELSEVHRKPASVRYAPFPTLSLSAVDQFEAVPTPHVWPELGSRAMLRLVESFPSPTNWIVVQPSRYRYAVLWGEAVSVRIVLSEYLACEVHFDTCERSPGGHD